eukprot:gene8546-33977_t
MVMLSFYEVLGVDQGASSTDIKAAYHRGALESHPDKQPGNAGTSSNAANLEIQFNLVQKAWEVLRSSDLRKVHDRELQLEAMREVLTFQDELGIHEMDRQVLSADSSHPSSSETEGGATVMFKPHFGVQR